MRPLGDVLDAKYMFGAFGRKVPTWYEDAVSVWFPLVLGICADAFLILVELLSGFLFWDQVNPVRGALWVKRAYDMGNNVKVHCVSPY